MWNKEVINTRTCPAVDQSATEFLRVRIGALTLSNYTGQNAKPGIIILSTFNQCISTRAEQSGLLQRPPEEKELIWIPGSRRSEKRPHSRRERCESLHQPIENVPVTTGVK